MLKHCFFQFANRYSTYRVPSLTEKPKELFKFLYQVAKPLRSTLVFFGVFQFVASSALTYYEIKNHLTVRRKVLELENRIREETAEGST